MRLSETSPRLILSLGAFALLFLAERIAPRLRPSGGWKRWLRNLSLGLLGLALIRLLTGIPLYLFSQRVAALGWGLIPKLHLPNWICFTLGFLSLDFAIWAQHVASHRWRWFWRLHRIHHLDPHMDLSTGLRFHPLELLLSFGFKAFMIFLLGPSALTVLFFEIALSFGTFFEHANLRLGSRIDPVIRFFLVTPLMHQVHHSRRSEETDSNFGFFIPWWDRLFRTYRAEAQAPLELGLDAAPEKSFLGLITWPFEKK
jgi:sterol desaturase/sphingolipid hydroxylase (fatty acid hydroxylase superfamily)